MRTSNNIDNANSNSNNTNNDITIKSTRCIIILIPLMYHDITINIIYVSLYN